MPRAKRPSKRDLEGRKGRAPKYILNPDYSETEEEKENLKDTIIQMGSLIDSSDNPFARADGIRAELMGYFPEEHDSKLPDEGAWILVKKSPETEYTVPPLSIWYALPWPMEDRRRGRGFYRVRIITPRGDLGILPHEYTVIKDITRYVGQEKEGMRFRFLSEDVEIPSDQLFYVMSRGIPRREATMMLLPELKSPNLGWFESSKEIADTFGYEWPSEERLATT
jgi:hypothetical protein